MKQLSLILNVVLIVAVGVLFFLHFNGRSENEPTTVAKGQSAESPAVKAGNIAYVQIDTLLSNMKMYKDLSETLAKKQQKMETEIGNKSKNFQDQVNDFQNKVQKGLITSREAQELDQQLSSRRMELENQRNDYVRQLQEENNVSQNKVIDYIMNYLNEYNKDNKYEYILSYSFGGGVLYADNRLDITNQVLAGINERYDKEHAKSK